MTRRRMRSAQEMLQSGILSAGEVANLFNVTSRTIMRWVASGQLVAFQTPGGNWRFRIDDNPDIFDLLQEY